MGSGKTRRWFRCRIEGEEGRLICLEKKRKALEGPRGFRPGSLAEFIDQVWWPHTKKKTTTSTQNDYRSILKTWLRPFYHRTLNEINQVEQLQAFVDAIDRSPKRVQNIWSVLESILNLASDLGRLKTKDYKVVLLPKPPARRIQQDMSYERVQKILAAAEGTDMYGPIWTAAWLGLRRNEICGLKRPHVKVLTDRAIITLQHNRQNHGEEPRLKSKRQHETRVLCVPRHWGEKILSFGPTDSLYIFQGKDGREIKPDRLTHGMEHVCRQAGVSHMAFKDLRTCLASEYEGTGARASSTMDTLGHSSIRTTTGYLDHRQDEQLAAFTRLESARCHPSSGEPVTPALEIGSKHGAFDGN